jgi:hypothetical protein
MCKCTSNIHHQQGECKTKFLGGRETIMLQLDASIAKQRHQEMLREAEQIRLARRIAQANGAQSLLSRTVKLLSRSSHPAEQPVQPGSQLAQQPLADAR